MDRRQYIFGRDHRFSDFKTPAIGANRVIEMALAMNIDHRVSKLGAVVATLFHARLDPEQFMVVMAQEGG